VSRLPREGEIPPMAGWRACLMVLIVILLAVGSSIALVMAGESPTRERIIERATTIKRAQKPIACFVRGGAPTNPKCKDAK